MLLHHLANFMPFCLFRQLQRNCMQQIQPCTLIIIINLSWQLLWHRLKHCVASDQSRKLSPFLMV